VRLPGAQLVDLPQILWRLIDHAVRDGDGDVDVGDVVGRIGAFAVFLRDVEGPSCSVWFMSAGTAPSAIVASSRSLPTTPSANTSGTELSPAGDQFCLGLPSTKKWA
jgi:hypothetical protein